MSAATDTRLRGRTRWSMAARCPRMAAYGLLGAEPEEPSERTKRLWRRGRQIGAAVADDFAAKYGEEEIVREKAVEWPTEGLPLGELHSDVFVKPEAMAVEVKSATSPSSILDDAITQLGGEILYDAEAEVGCLAIADPTGWNETSLIPVILTDELQERVESIAAQVVDSARTGVLPDRVCQKPSDARGRMCSFAEVCFTDWTPPHPLKLDDDIANVARELKAAQDAERSGKAVVAEAEARRKELSTQLAEWELVPGMEYVGAGVRVTRTKVADTEKLSLTTVKKAGLWTPELAGQLGPFVKASGGHDRWKVIEDTPAAIEEGDWGDDAPWTDEDLANA